MKNNPVLTICFNICFSILLFFSSNTGWAIEPLPTNLISFSSPFGTVLFKRNMNLNAIKLLSHFTTQETGTYCGVVSAVMVLNAANLPKPLDKQHPPYHYFDQNNFFNQITTITTPEKVRKTGMTLTILQKILKDYGLHSTAFFANQLNQNTFRKILKNSLKKERFIIVNFLRTALHQKGVGHHSPLVAYDEKSDRFLILDVARYKYAAYWVKTADLWRAVHTKDYNHYRGFVVAY